MTSARITLIGSYNTDLVVFTPRMPTPGETILGRHFVSGPGGKGSNQAVAAARMGAHVTFVGRIGQDANGQMALDLWRREGIDAGYVVRSAENHTGVASILVDDAGENMIVVASGANMDVVPTDTERAENAIILSGAVVGGLEVPLEAVVRAFELARQHGVPTVLNPAPAQPLAREVLALADYLTPNRTEAAQITGVRTDDPEAAARALRDCGAHTVVMTLGSQGVLLYDDGGARRFPAFPVEVVDTTGAGDAFNGAFAAGVAEGLALDEAIRLAMAAAALSVTREGAASSMPTRDEVERFLRER